MRMVSPGLRWRGGLKPDPTPVQIKYVVSAGLQVRAQAPITVQTMSNQFAWPTEPSCAYSRAEHHWFQWLSSPPTVMILTCRCACSQYVPSLKGNASRYCWYQLRNREYHFGCSTILTKQPCIYIYQWVLIQELLLDHDISKRTKWKNTAFEVFP
jgi:hypothetical protein